jgi:hypothetical protein
VSDTTEIEAIIMRKALSLTALAALLALPLIAGPTSASASCQGRKDTGMVLGGLGGALLGNSISKGGGGAVVGGLGGAVVGHELAKGGCGGSRHAYYRRGHSRYAESDNRSPARKTYYDQHGYPVTSAYDAPRSDSYPR